MLEISAIPYIVFALMAIPPFIFGYFKGWRSGVFTLLSTLAVGGILVGTSFAIYNNTLWPLFSKIFIENHNPAGLDIEALKEISKQSVISITVGIGIVPGMLTTLVLYLIFKKMFNRYMFPNLKRVSENETTIKRKNLKLTRAGGVLINGTAGLIVASAVAGAISTLTVPYKNSNFFQKFSSVVGDGMTFGQASYDEGYQQMFEFVKDGNSFGDQITLLQKAFGLKLTAVNTFEISKETFDGFVKDSYEHEQFIKRSNRMATNSEEVSKALVLLILNGIKDDAFNLVATGEKDITKLNASDDKIEVNLVALEKFLETNNDWGIKWNRNGVRDGISEIYKSRFDSYENSSYFTNWTTGKDNLKTNKENLTAKNKQKQDDLKFIESNKDQPGVLIKSIEDDRESIVNDWKQMIKYANQIGTGDNFDETPILEKLEYSLFDTESGKETKNSFEEIKLGGIAPKNTGLFKEMKDAEAKQDKSKKELDSQKRLKDDAKSDLTDAQNSEAEAKKDFDDATKVESSSKAKLESANKAKSTAQSKLTVTENQKNALQTEAEQKEGATSQRFDDLNDAITSKTEKERALTTEKQKKENLESKLKKLSKNTLEYETTADEIKGAQAAINKASREFNDASNKLSKARTDYQKALAASTIASAASEKALIAFKNAGDALETAKEDVSNAKEKYETAQGETERTKQDYSQATVTKTTAQNKYNGTLEPYENALSQFTKDKKACVEAEAAYNKIDDKIKKISTKIQNTKDDFENNYKSLGDISSSLSGKINNKIMLSGSKETKGSIKEQEEKVKNLQDTLEKLTKIKEDKEKEYKGRSKRIIDALTNALS